MKRTSPQTAIDIAQPEAGEPIKLQGIYLRKIRRRQRMDMWIVNGSRVRSHIFDEFLEGGNDQRYRFVPPNEIWIDGSTSVEEFEYALMHELHERHLMQTKGMSYDRAHTESLMVELNARRKMRLLCQQHELKQYYMPPTDVHGTQEIADIGNKIELREVYRYRIGRRGRQTIWIVDGAHVRRDIFPDFGFSGNDCAYKFIPPNEIWIDNQMDCFELEYQMAHQSVMRAAMVRGVEEATAYGKASDAQTRARRVDEAQAKRKEQRTPLVTGGTRARGVRSTRNNRK
ncbi:MAG: hypothetical protein ABI874_04380 [Chloroflexota bacterium]